MLILIEELSRNISTLSARTQVPQFMYQYCTHINFCDLTNYEHSHIHSVQNQKSIAAACYTITTGVVSVKLYITHTTTVTQVDNHEHHRQLSDMEVAALGLPAPPTMGGDPPATQRAHGQPHEQQTPAQIHHRRAEAE